MGDRKVRLHGVSRVSLQDARLKMEERARLWERFLSCPASEAAIGEFRHGLRALDDLGGEYSACILEPVEEVVNGENIMTRNRYGSLVLNSVSVCFVDIDHFRPRGFAAWLASLFGGWDAQSRLLEAAEACCQRGDAAGARVYRTAHGWRVILHGVELGSARLETLFAALQADPLYVRLCARQQCWRARLSPKPFHLGLPRFPRWQDSDNAPAGMAEWVEKYKEKTEKLGVCRLVAVLGAEVQDPVVELHDRLTRALEEGLRLA